MPLYALGDATPTIHPTAFVHPDAVVIGAVELGEQVSVWPGAVLRADFGSIHVGARTSIQDGTVLHTTPQWPTTVGEDCVVGHLAHLEGCVVEDRCLVGSGSIVLNRSRVGTGSVVGAGAVTREDMQVPPGSLAVGVPAKLLAAPADIEHWILDAVGKYLGNAARYRGELRRLPDHVPDGPRPTDDRPAAAPAPDPRTEVIA